MGRPRKNLIAQMRASAGEAEVLLRAYDLVLADLDDNHIRWMPINQRRNRLESDMRRLRNELALLESREPLR